MREPYHLAMLLIGGALLALGFGLIVFAIALTKPDRAPAGPVATRLFRWIVLVAMGLVVAAGLTLFGIARDGPTPPPQAPSASGLARRGTGLPREGPPPTRSRRSPGAQITPRSRSRSRSSPAGPGSRAPAGLRPGGEP